MSGKIDLLSAIEKPTGQPIIFTDTPEAPPTPAPKVTTETVAPETETKPEVVTKEAEIKQPETSVVPEVPEYLKKWNELSGGKITLNSDEEAKKFIENNEKISAEYEGLKGVHEKMTEIENFVREKNKDFDPVKKVGGVENYKKTYIAAELAGGSQNVDVQMLALKIVKSDLDKTKDLDLLSQIIQVKTPSLIGNDKQTKEAILSELGVDTDDLDFDNLELEGKVVARIAIKAAEARETLKNKIASVKVPDIENPITEIINKFDQNKIKTEELKGKWKEAESLIKGSLSKLEFSSIGFDYQIKEDVSDIVSEYINAAAQKGWEFSEANKQKVLKAIQEEIWSRDRNKILAARDAFMEGKIRTEYLNKYENREPLSTPNSPVLTDDKSKAQEVLRRTLNI